MRRVRSTTQAASSAARFLQFWFACLTQRPGRALFSNNSRSHPVFCRMALPYFRASFFCIGSQLELTLQAAPWCRGAGDSKSADVPPGGERPRSYLPLSIFIMYKFDVQLPFSRWRRCRWTYPAHSKSFSALCTVRGERHRSRAMVFTPGQQLPPPARSRRYI